MRISLSLQPWALVMLLLAATKAVPLTFVILLLAATNTKRLITNPRD